MWESLNSRSNFESHFGELVLFNWNFCTFYSVTSSSYYFIKKYLDCQISWLIYLFHYVLLLIMLLVLLHFHSISDLLYLVRIMDSHINFLVFYWELYSKLYEITCYLALWWSKCAIQSDRRWILASCIVLIYLLYVESYMSNAPVMEAGLNISMLYY